MQKNTSYARSFNIFNKDAAREMNSQRQPKRQPAPEKKVIDLHFINPNILYLDVKKRLQCRARTAGPQNCNENARRVSRPKTKASARLLSSTMKPGSGLKERQSSVISQRVNEYIKLEKIFLEFRKNGYFSPKSIAGY